MKQTAIFTFPVFRQTPYKGYSKTCKGVYRYGFNGKENDNEIKGLGDQQDYGMRVYDTRLGKFLSVDPLSDDYPYYSTYQFAGNMPISFIDLDGCEPAKPGTEKGEFQLAKNNFDEYGGDHGWTWDGDKWNDGGRSLNEALITADKVISLKNSQSNISSRNIGSASILKKESQIKSTSNNVDKFTTPWMKTALKEKSIGVRETKENSGPRVDIYLKFAGLKSPNKWCASFAHWCLGQNGIKGGGGRGENWLKWGVKLENPKYGAIAIFKTNHIGFYMGKNPDGTLIILHGNWSDMIKISSGIYDPIYPKDIKEYRFPENY